MAKKASPAAKVAKKAPAPRAKKSTARLGTFEDLTAPYPPEVRAIADRLREVVREVMPKAEETVYLGWKIALYADPNEVCGISPLKDRCNFYLTRGTELRDPEGLLEGTGKGIRHVKVRSVDGLKVGPIKKLIREGRKLARG